MPLSAVQKGAIGQFAFLATALVTGRGQVEVYTPAADNEGRDAEVRRHLRRAASVGIQVKVAFGMVVKNGRREYLSLRFFAPEQRVSIDPRLWYFLAVYDLRQLRFYDPVFLIPSAVLHRLAHRSKTSRGTLFSIEANLAPGSNDELAPYRVAPRDLGKRLLGILDDGGETARLTSGRLPAEAILVRKRKRRVRGSRRMRAA
jgi:hypothetical protein